ncbi:MAG: MoxR family ATPase [Planctomycetota bacterium]|nr:MAG: MoxR family ATPase [Planctomycetota bacterium]
MDQAHGDDLEAIGRLQRAHEALRAEIGKAIVGQEQVVDELLTCIFARGHCILEGVPGLAKTLLVSTLARTLSLGFHRIQFTPDLMPSDITGTEVIRENKSTGERELVFLPGPVFANVVLADEINRTPPKTQAALLEAMQERQVTAGGKRRPLEAPFFVLATQNPIEQEGTYPLPEAQQDRFMFKVLVDYPSADEERRIVEATTSDREAGIEPVLTREEILDLQGVVRRVPAAPSVVDHAIELVRKTRVRSPEGVPEFVRRWVAWGAGPRASQYLVLGAKARAALRGRPCATVQDLRAVAKPVLRHRVLTNFAAEAEGVTPDRVIEELLESTPPTGGDLSANPDVSPAFQG